MPGVDTVGKVLYLADTPGRADSNLSRTIEQAPGSCLATTGGRRQGTYRLQASDLQSQEDKADQIVNIKFNGRGGGPDATLLRSTEGQ